MTPVSPTETQTKPATRARARGRADQLCAEAVDLARAAAEEVAEPGEVGEHIGVEPEGERLVTHRFACLAPAYQGWRWAVTVVRAPRAKNVTVAEVVLLPGAESLLAPEWVPWSERVRPGDLGPGDLLPTQEDDPRLAPGYTGADENLADELAADVVAGESARMGLLAYELGRGRARVLSREGREDATRRWYRGHGGPHTPVARSAPAQCSTCGFFHPLAGPLGRAFGVCANGMSPSDGIVVSGDHGCGAHSEAVRAPQPSSSARPVLDEAGYEHMHVPAETGTAAPGRRGRGRHSPGSVDESDAEDLGHS